MLYVIGSLFRYQFAFVLRIFCGIRFSGKLDDVAAE
jgi:hypothetical protein